MSFRELRLPFLVAVAAGALCSFQPAQAGETLEHCGDGSVDGWCSERGVGYLAGIEIRSEVLFEALDAHGHEIAPETLDCDACAAAYVSGGYCDDHRRGWVRGLAYLSPLTYQLARGRRVDPATLECGRRIRGDGWCDEHALGLIGNVAIGNRDDFEAAARALHTLTQAQETAERCELCAAAMVGDGRCPVCRITYVDGKPLPDPPRSTSSEDAADAPRQD